MKLLLSRRNESCGYWDIKQHRYPVRMVSKNELFLFVVRGRQHKQRNKEGIMREHVGTLQ